MNKILRFAAGLLATCLALCCALPAAAPCAAAQEGEVIDYAGAVTLDMASPTVKQEVTVHGYVDGDTTHFNVPSSVVDTGVLKARYLAINTPETTNHVEEYGKKAAAFTREKLSAATSIILESDDGRWNLDSTGGRYLAWVWYRTDETQPYRNLNIEILQNGLAIANSAANNRYGETCMAAIAQAKAQKLNIYSGQPDPDFFYGDAIELTLKALRSDPQAYDGKKVAFEGVITMNDSNTVYVESYDEETGLCYGVPVYYGYSLNGQGLSILKVGNLSRIVGTFQYYEPGDSYQVAGLTYRIMKPDDPENLQKISEGHQPAYVPVDAETFLNGQVTLQGEDGQTRSYPFAELALATSVQMQGLTVREAWAEQSGKMTLLCDADGLTVRVRTNALRGADGAPLTPETLKGKTLDVRGIVGRFEGEYQIEVFADSGLTIHP